MATCAHCRLRPATVGTACQDCAVRCAVPPCTERADPAEIGGMCPLHAGELPNNLLEVEEPNAD